MSDLDALRNEVDDLLRDGRHIPSYTRRNELYVTVLRATAAGHPDAARMAEQVLRIADASLARWYS